jgi:O-acetyl-ADP-ribose deacetylase (regulator of RNase III)
VWTSKEDLSGTLRDCYTNSLRVAGELAATSVAFPLISAGAYGWPKADAVQQALTAITGAPQNSVELVRLVLFDLATLAVAERVRARIEGR